MNHLLIFILAAVLPARSAAQTMLVRDGRVVVSRVGEPSAERPTLARLRPSNARARRRLAALGAHRAYRCELEGRFVLLGFGRGRGGLISEFKVVRVGACRALHRA